MFDNALNRDTVYYIGLLNDVWQTTEVVCERLNREGFALTIEQTETLLSSLAKMGKIIQAEIMVRHEEIWHIWYRLDLPLPENTKSTFPEGTKLPCPVCGSIAHDGRFHLDRDSAGNTA